MSEPAIRCDKCGKKFRRSEGDMSPTCGQCHMTGDAGPIGPTGGVKLEPRVGQCPLCEKDVTVEDNVVQCVDPKCPFYGDGFVYGNGDWAIDTNDTEFAHIDSAKQMLRFRVGPVFSGDKVVGTGLWISYQEEAWNGKLQGDILMSKEAWIKLRDNIDCRWML